MIWYLRVMDERVIYGRNLSNSVQTAITKYKNTSFQALYESYSNMSNL